MANPKRNKRTTRKGKRKPAIAWELMEAEYVQGIVDKNGVRTFPSLRDLAKRHKLHMRTLADHCGKERWVDKREQFLNDVAARQREILIKELSERGAQFDTDCFTVAELGVKKLKMTMDKIAARDSAIDPGIMVDVGNALRHLQSCGRLAIGKGSVEDDEETMSFLTLIQEIELEDADDDQKRLNEGAA